MPGAIAREVAGAAARLVRLPYSARRRSSTLYVRLLARVFPDRIWGGWSFEGPVFRPGVVISEDAIVPPGLALECAGSTGSGRGHDRAPTLYILWRYERPTGEWRELARVAALERDWTVALGPIAKRELDPPRPFLLDPRAAAGRICELIERELEPLEFKARVLVVRAVEDHLMAGLAG